MHFTLHITTGCSMSCGYCYSPPRNRSDMSEETALQAVEFAARLSPFNPGLIFFGGEPLLRKDIIRLVIDRCRSIERDGALRFHFKVTTNGLHLDREFLEYADGEGLITALSHDGVREAHDLHRKTRAGDGTFDLLCAKIPLLLEYQPYAPVMMAVTPETVEHYTDSVRFLFEKGFRYIVASLNYAGRWTGERVRVLKRRYEEIAELYEAMTAEGRKFYFSPFETKLASHIRGEDALCERCHLAMRQVSIAPDGTIYPCVQFVKDGVSNREFAIGNVWDGFDEEKRTRLFTQSQEDFDACRECGIRDRCNHRCSCLNWQTTGSLNEVSPALCETERVLVPLVDRMGERLFRKRSRLFIQKHYNAVYPILSLIEDRCAPDDARDTAGDAASDDVNEAAREATCDAAGE